MNPLYPRERVEAAVQSLNVTTACRLLWRQYLSDPLSVRQAPSRFSDGRSYGVLYAALEFETAFVEVVVRDHFVQRSSRVLPLDDVLQRGWVEFETPRDSPLLLLDLRESGCVKLGIPTDAVHARNQAAGRALGRVIYEQYPDIDGIRYSSRLTGGECLAIFDRALGHLLLRGSGELEQHHKLPAVLRTDNIVLVE